MSILAAKLMLVVVLVFLYMDSQLFALIATKSVLPSRFRSAIAISVGFPGVEILGADAKEFVVKGALAPGKVVMNGTAE
jgi:hypothetical protein